MRENAITYLSNPAHGDIYALPMLDRGRLHVAVFTRAQMLQGVESGKAYNVGALAILSDGETHLRKVMRDKLQQAFGAPRYVLPTDYRRYEDLPADGTGNAPRARAWEKVVITTMNAGTPFKWTWTGGLNHVQVDGKADVGGLRVEIKGLNGRINEYRPE